MKMKDQLEKKFQTYGRAISDYPEHIIQFILKHFDYINYQWLVNQICGLEDLCHRSITIEDVEKILRYKEEV